MLSIIVVPGGMQTTKWYHGVRDDFGQALLFVEERDKDMRVVHRLQLKTFNQKGIDWSYIGDLPYSCAVLIIANLIGDTDEPPTIRYKHTAPAMLLITSSMLAGLPRGEWKLPAADFVKHLWFRDRMRYRWNRFTRTFKRKDIDGI